MYVLGLAAGAIVLCSGLIASEGNRAPSVSLTYACRLCQDGKDDSFMRRMCLPLAVIGSPYAFVFSLGFCHEITLTTYNVHRMRGESSWINQLK